MSTISVIFFFSSEEISAADGCFSSTHRHILKEKSILIHLQFSAFLYANLCMFHMQLIFFFVQTRMK